MRSVSSKLTLTELYTSLYHLGDLDRKHLRMILVASIEKCPDMRLRPWVSVCQSLCWRHKGTNAYKSKCPMSFLHVRSMAVQPIIWDRRERDGSDDELDVRPRLGQPDRLDNVGSPRGSGVHVIVESGRSAVT